MGVRTTVGSVAMLVLLAGPSAYAATPAAAPSPTPPPGRILFSRWDDDLGDFQAFAVNSDGSGESLLVPGAHEIPHWSPDGASVSTTAISPDGRVLPAIIGADGSGYRELPIEAPLNLGCPVWSPDGQQLLCEGWVDADPQEAGLRRINAADGSSVTRLTSEHDVPGGTSPDGRTIAFVRIVDEKMEGGELWLAQADGSHQTRLSDRTVGLQVSWSPDGTRILADGTDGSLFTVDVADGTITPIPTPAGSVAYEADWSPDGTWLAFSMHVNGEPTSDVYAMRLDGSGLIQLTDTPGVKDESPDWTAAH